jgi:exonuclease 3'-5' domain-containing protein 1
MSTARAMSPPEAQIKLVDSVALIQDLVEDIVSRVRKPLIFVDLEGANLSRDGSVAIMQVLVPPNPTVHLIDVHLLQDKAFQTSTGNGYTWKEILGSDSHAKVFFDVRNDSDALYHHYGVSLRGVMDLQLLEFATRPGRNRPQFLKGLSKCITESGILSHQEARAWEQVKDEGVRQFAPEKGGTYDVFLRRPLSSTMQNYCAEDVLRLPRLLVCYARQITRHLAGEVAREALARVALSQTPWYDPHGREKARGPIINWHGYLITVFRVNSMH